MNFLNTINRYTGSRSPKINATFHYMFNANDGYTEGGQYYVRHTEDPGVVEFNPPASAKDGKSENGIATIYNIPGSVREFSQFSPDLSERFTGACTSQASVAINRGLPYVTQGSCTVCFWCYVDENKLSPNPFTYGNWIFCYQTDKGNVAINVKSTEEFAIVVYDTFNPGFFNNKRLDLNYSYHFCIVADKTTNQLLYYVNGVISNVNASPYTCLFPSGASTTNRFSLGYTTNSTKGAHQDFRYYDYALTPAYIQSIYNNGYGTWKPK